MTFSIDNQSINIVIVKKRIKNIYFRFDEDLNLVISASKLVSEKEIERLIKKNEKSLINMYYKCVKKSNKSNEFWWKGKKYIIVINNEYDNVIIDDGYIYAKSNIMLDKYISNETSKWFKEEVLKLKSIIKTPEFKLRIRKMKTRWGVCNYKDNIITLNSDLNKYNEYCLRYVIIHEMCHFKHHNHSNLFWQEVEKYCPYYKEARKELRSQ